MNRRPLNRILERCRVASLAVLRWAAPIALAAFVGTQAWPAQDLAAAPQVVARVNGEPVTREQWERMRSDPLTARVYQRERNAERTEGENLDHWALQRLIDQRLVLQYAAKRNFAVSAADVERAVAAWRERFKAPRNFRAWLQSRRLDEQALRELIRTDMLVTRVRAEVIREVRVPDAEIQAYYENHRCDLEKPEEVLLQIIAAKDGPTADGIVAAAGRGEDFERLAKERSMASRAAQLGDGRWFASSELPPPLRDAIALLNPGEITDALQGGAEFVVARLEQRRPARLKTLHEAWSEIEQRLRPAKQQEALQSWLRTLGERSTIEVLTL